METKIFEFPNGNGYVYYVSSSNREIDESNFPYFGWHRPAEEGPAYEDYNECEMEYWEHNQAHRYDGPAIMKSRGNYIRQWRIRGFRIKPELYLTWLEENGMDINNLTVNDKLLIDLKWGMPNE